MQNRSRARQTILCRFGGMHLLWTWTTWSWLTSKAQPILKWPSLNSRPTTKWLTRFTIKSNTWSHGRGDPERLLDRPACVVGWVQQPPIDWLKRFTNHSVPGSWRGRWWHCVLCLLPFVQIVHSSIDQKTAEWPHDPLWLAIHKSSRWVQRVCCKHNQLSKYTFIC